MAVVVPIWRNDVLVGRELMDEKPLGKGTLANLECLKEEYRETFRATAPKRRKIGQRCADLLCPYLIGQAGVGRDGIWRIKNEWCDRKRCPRERAE